MNWNGWTPPIHQEGLTSATLHLNGACRIPVGLQHLLETKVELCRRDTGEAGILFIAWQVDSLPDTLIGHRSSALELFSESLHF